MSNENLIDEGRYLAKVTEAVLAKASNGNWQVAVGFEILSPEGAAGRLITWYGSLAKTVVTAGKYEGKTVAEMTVDSLETCGWDGEGLEETSLATAVGNEVSIVIAHDEYDGNVKAKVKFINPPNSLGAAVKERATANEAANVTKQFQGLLMKRKQQRQARGATQKPAQQKRQHRPPNAGDAWEPPQDDWLDDLG
jgi:hypothetical protein